MEFFNEAKAVRFKSHLDKYLVADEDQHTVRQSHNGSSEKARWIVEFVAGNPHVVRLKSCHGGYLTASDDAFLLGMTGKKVTQSVPDTKKDGSVEWEPIREGYKVKLRTRGGKFLRANGATPPWRNSITHDLPHRTATQDWVLWDVDVVDIGVLDGEYLSSNGSSFSSVRDDYLGSNSPSMVSEGRRQIPVTTDGRRELSVFAQHRWPSIGYDRSSHRNGRQAGVEFFDKAKAVRLQSHLGKYLVADDDEETVRQSRNDASQKARWTVEFVDGKRDTIRLKSCHGLYLTASNEPFLLGMTGRKVLQTLSEKKMDVSIEWEPVKEGLHVKLMTSDGKFLRANGGSPPWRNSVTHDVPHRTATQNWVLWGVEVVDILIMDTDMDSGSLSPASNFSSMADDFSGSPDTGSPMVRFSVRSRNLSDSGLSDTGSPSMRDCSKSDNISMEKVSGMEFFRKAKSVRLKSHHEKFLTADTDEESVIQDRFGTSKQVRWEVEFVEGVENVIRLKSCYSRYLTALDDEYLLGVTGRKVVQSTPRKLDSSVEWEPIRDGMQVRLKTRYGNYLRANGGLTPWRNSITHDIPHRHRDWILWAVDVVEIRPESPPKVARSGSLDDDLSSTSFSLRSPVGQQFSNTFQDSPRKSEGRLIYYHVVDDDGKVDDSVEGPSFQFKGLGLEELTQKLEEETGHEDVIVCSRSRVNGQLYPLRLALPPNNATMHVVVIPSTSTAAKEFLPSSPTST